MSVSRGLKIISLIMLLIQSNRNLGVAKLLNVSLPDRKKLRACFSLFSYCFCVVFCSFGAVLPDYHPANPMPLTEQYIFLLSWYLPTFHPAVSVPLVPLPVYWSVVLCSVTILRALLFAVIFIPADTLGCSCCIDLTFSTLLCFYHISTHSPAKWSWHCMEYSISAC